MKTLCRLLGLATGLLLLAPASARAADCAWVMSWARADGYDDTKLEIERRASLSMTVERALEDSRITAGTPEHAAAKSVFEGCYAIGYGEGVKEAKSFSDKVDRAARWIERTATDAALRVYVAVQRLLNPEEFDRREDLASGSNVSRDAVTRPSAPASTTPPTGGAAGAGTARD